MEEGLGDENYSGVENPKDQENDSVNEALKNEENDRVGDSKGQENNKVEKDQKNELNAFLQDLLKELRDVYNDLPKNVKAYFTKIRDYELRMEYLTMARSIKKNNVKKKYVFLISSIK